MGVAIVSSFSPLIKAELDWRESVVNEPNGISFKVALEAGENEKQCFGGLKRLEHLVSRLFPLQRLLSFFLFFSSFFFCGIMLQSPQCRKPY